MADHPDMNATGRGAGEPSDGFVRATVPNLLSIIVPAYNEGESVRRLLEEIEAALEPMACAYEVIIIDDGSDDGTGDVLTGLSRKNRQIKLIQFRRNFGKAAALDAGFQLARGTSCATGLTSTGNADNRVDYAVHQLKSPGNTARIPSGHGNGVGARLQIGNRCGAIASAPCVGKMSLPNSNCSKRTGDGGITTRCLINANIQATGAKIQLKRQAIWIGGRLIEGADR